MFAFTFVRAARPIAIGSSLYFRWLMFAGITIRPAATSSRTAASFPGNSTSKRLPLCHAASHASRSPVDAPTRAMSPGANPAGGVTRRVSPFASVNVYDSHAVHGDDAHPRGDRKLPPPPPARSECPPHPA